MQPGYCFVPVDNALYPHVSLSSHVPLRTDGKEGREKPRGDSVSKKMPWATLRVHLAAWMVASGQCGLGAAV